MLKSHPPVEKDNVSQPMSVSANDKAEIDNGDFGIGHEENRLPTEEMEVLNTTSMTVGGGDISELAQSIDGENDHDIEASNNIDFAVSLMEQCVAELSLPDLENVISLFWKILKQSAGTHPLQFDAMWGLISSAGLKFVHAKDEANFIEFLKLGGDLPANKPGLTDISSDDDNSGTNLEILEMAQTTLMDLRKSTSLSTINTIIFLLHQSLAVLPTDHPKRRLARTNLAYGMYIRFHHSNNIADVHSATSILRSDRKVYSEDEQQEIDELQQFEATAAERMDNTGILTSGDSSRRHSFILRSRKAVSLVIYAQSLIDEFDTSGNINDLEDGIALTQAGLMELSVSSPTYVKALSILANALGSRFEQQGDAQDLDEAISLHRQALALRPPPHPDRSNSLTNLGILLITRFEQRGAAQDLDEFIPLFRQALEYCPLSHPHRFSSLYNLANALSTQFKHRGGLQNLNDAISFYKQAIELRPMPQPDLSGSLGNALLTRFKEQGNAQDLNEAIELDRQALALRPPPHPHRSVSLTNLASALLTRFHQQGDAQDLNEAISFHRQALELFSPSYSHRSNSINNLANALWTRFEHQGDTQDLNEAISFHRQALELWPPAHPGRPSSFNNLASALTTRFKQQGDAKDLNEAVSFLRQALELFPPPHHDRSRSLGNLASALLFRFQQLGDVQDLNEAMSFYKHTLELRPPPHPDRFDSLNNLAIALWTRFERQGDAQDLSESIYFHNQALELTPPPHPARSASLNNLAIALLTGFEQIGDTSYLEQGMLSFSEATHSPSQSSSQRFQHARVWAGYAYLYQHPSAITAFDVTLSILPELAALGLDIQSRQDSLAKGTDGLARKAARCAVHAGNLDKAVEFLETGRGVFWSQCLSLRSPFDQLHDITPQLVNELRSISQELEEGSLRAKSTANMDNKQKLSWEKDVQRFEQLAKKWKETVDRVRDLDGFEDFLQPQKLSTLQTAARKHPIIYLVEDDNASSCLIMTSTLVHHIPLPNLPTHVLRRLVNLVQIAASDHQIPRSAIEGMAENWADLPQPLMQTLQHLLDEEEERGMRRKILTLGHLSSDNIFRGVLRMLWDEAVKPVIEFLGIKKSNKTPTLTWCTTGLFTFLPIHAAGSYDEGHVDCTSHYIISSYTPTIGALLTSNPLPVEPFRMMAVIESSSLPSTREELKRIERHVAGNSLIKFGTPDMPASVEAVASRLSTASIVHFACHGKQDSTRPLESGLEIGDERLKISRIMKESVPNGPLAFLSACETAMGDEKIPDEAMNIGASLLFTGFRSVVATMWRMWDEDGPVVADAFYRELFKGPDGNPMALPDTSKSAEALAIAVNELRTRGVPFKRWVPFIHMGK